MGEEEQRKGLSRWLPLVMIVLGVGAMVFNLYMTISNLAN